MSLGILIQARTGSQRLPGKVLRPIAGKPLLEYLVERAGRVAGARLVVATSTVAGDDAVAEFCGERGVECFRGDESNVSGRLAEAAAAYGFEAFVRLSGDSPLVDPNLIDRCVERFDGGGFDLVTNVFPRSFPPGSSVEVIRAAAFARALARMTEPEDREHVTRIFYRRPQEFAIDNVRAEADYRGVHLAVDTARDLRRIRTLIERMEQPHWQVGLDEVVRLYRRVVAEEGQP